MMRQPVMRAPARAADSPHPNSLKPGRAHRPTRAAVSPLVFVRSRRPEWNEK